MICNTTVPLYPSTQQQVNGSLTSSGLTTAPNDHRPTCSERHDNNNIEVPNSNSSYMIIDDCDMDTHENESNNHFTLNSLNNIYINTDNNSNTYNNNNKNHHTNKETDVIDNHTGNINEYSNNNNHDNPNKHNNR